ncbi:MAG: hypothetical protein U1C51_06970, partial [Candidatus Izemoplasmatales bacterium]|nr:hypothetical protein [Candidatus Izemoplasmatales bacterium]
ASISKQLIDTSNSGDILLPYFDVFELPLRIEVGDSLDQTDTIYIIKTEITALIDALGVLDIDDIESFSGSVDLSLLTQEGAMTTLLTSAIIHATISDQLFGLNNSNTIQVPTFKEDGSDLRFLVGDALLFTDTLYIEKAELEAMIDALRVLEITDIESFTGTVDLGLLSVEGNSDIVLSSSIIQATISTQLLDLAASDTINLPYFDSLGEQVRISVGDVLDNTFTTYVSKEELGALFDALNALEISDVESFEGSVDLSLLSNPAVVDTVLSSAIIHATVSKQILDLHNSDTIYLPYFDSQGVELRILVGDIIALTNTEFVLKDELKALFDALDVLQITDVETFSGSVDLSLLSDSETADTVLSSAIIHATVSKQILDLHTSDTIYLPYFDSTNVELRINVGVILDSTDTKYVLKAELKALFDALDVLQITDVETFNGTVDLGLLGDEATANTVLSSAIIHATISKQLLDLASSNTLSIPRFSADLVNLHVFVGDTLDQTDTNYIIKAELINLFDALDVLGIGDVESFAGSVNLSLLADQQNRDTVLGSSIIHATISTQLFDLNSSSTITLPYLDISELKTIVQVTGDILDSTNFNYVHKDELKELFEALDFLGITDVQNFDGALDLSLFYTPANRQILLDSSIMHATISTQLLDLGDAVLRVPYKDEIETFIRKMVGVIVQTEYITQAEIDAIFETLELLGIDDIQDFDGDIDLSIFYDQNNRDTLLGSASMHATISKQLLELDATALDVPTHSIDNVQVLLTIGDVGKTTDFVSKAEINALFASLELLNITDITTFDGAIDLTIFFTEVNQNTLLSSASMHKTVSKQLLDLGSNVLLVPVLDIASEDIQRTVQTNLFLVKSEIKAIFNALEVLDVTSISGFTGAIDLNNIYDDSSQNILLSSASMHATISKQLFDLGDAALLVPS